MKSRVVRWLAEAANEAVVREALTTPKPGLVDAKGRGCHYDMDFALFIKSARAIAPFWRAQAEIGLSGISPELAMTKLRPVGAAMERAMFLATGGINTHKGLIYLMSLLLYGAGNLIHSGEKFSAEAATFRASCAVAGVVKRELLPLKSSKESRALSNGERLFVEYGITGVRGEVERGFPSVLKYGLPTFSNSLARGASWNNAGLAALLEIMTTCEDSNVIHRAGYGYWRNIYIPNVKRAAQEFNSLIPNYTAMYKLEAAFRQFRVSPGGAADLLSCTYFLNLLK